MEKPNDKIINDDNLSAFNIDNILESLAKLNISTDASLNTSTEINNDASDSSFDHPSTSRKRIKTQNYSSLKNIKKRRVEMHISGERRRKKKKRIRSRSLSATDSSCDSFLPRPNYVILKNSTPLAISTPSNSPAIKFLSSVAQLQPGFRPPKIRVRPRTRRCKRRMKSFSSSKESRCEPEDYPSSDSLGWESDDLNIRSSTEYRNMELTDFQLASNMLHDEKKSPPEDNDD